MLEEFGFADGEGNPKRRVGRLKKRPVVPPKSPNPQSAANTARQFTPQQIERINTIVRAHARENPHLKAVEDPRGPKGLLMLAPNFTISPAPTPSFGQRVNDVLNTATAPLQKVDEVFSGARIYFGSKGAKAAYNKHVQDFMRAGYTKDKAEQLTREYYNDPNFLANFFPGAAADIRDKPVLGPLADVGTSFISPSSALTGGTLGIVGKAGKTGQV